MVRQVHFPEKSGTAPPEDDFIPTIHSDGYSDRESVCDSDNEEFELDEEFSKGFSYDPIVCIDITTKDKHDADQSFDAWTAESIKMGQCQRKAKVSSTNLDDIIARQRVKYETRLIHEANAVVKQAKQEHDDGDEDDDIDMNVEADADANPHIQQSVSSPSSPEYKSNTSHSVNPPDPFFDHEYTQKSMRVTSTKNTCTSATTFHDLGLSRALMKGIALLGFTHTTPIQARAIPVALNGRDIVGGAETGSGKTAAFLIPVIERLMYRRKCIAVTRVAILMPTRELAIQCFTVARKLAAYTGITFAPIVGGYSLREQEAVLKRRPDVIIATPGRFIDHMRNSAGFCIETIEILVLDEADRILEDGFADELNQILTVLPKSRQTILFSATMNPSVDELVRVGMTKPVKLIVNQFPQPVKTLQQEFLRIRSDKLDMRPAYLVYLCTNLYTQRVIVFVREKRQVHHLRILLALNGIKCLELHGNMSQEDRINSITKFRQGIATHLLATDLASRGLDIKNCEIVINYEVPTTLTNYLHRIGRTARAGKTGKSCTIVTDDDRKFVKSVVKHLRRDQSHSALNETKEDEIIQNEGEPSSPQSPPPVPLKMNPGIQVLKVPYDRIREIHEKLTTMESTVQRIVKEEKSINTINNTERDLTRAENLLKHREEIFSRPRRTWFKTKPRPKRAGRKGVAGQPMYREPTGKSSRRREK